MVSVILKRLSVMYHPPQLCCVGHIPSYVCLHTHIITLGISYTFYTFSTSVSSQGVSRVMNIAGGCDVVGISSMPFMCTISTMTMLSFKGNSFTSHHHLHGNYLTYSTYQFCSVLGETCNRDSMVNNLHCTCI